METVTPSRAHLPAKDAQYQTTHLGVTKTVEVVKVRSRGQRITLRETGRKDSFTISMADFNKAYQPL